MVDRQMWLSYVQLQIHFGITSGAKMLGAIKRSINSGTASTKGLDDV